MAPSHPAAGLSENFPLPLESQDKLAAPSISWGSLTPAEPKGWASRRSKMCQTPPTDAVPAEKARHDSLLLRIVKS